LIMSFEKVIVTMWGKWVELWTGPELQKYAANAIKKVTDPTGAWDAFRWWLLTWLSTWQSWSDAIALWQRLAWLCIQTKGTMEWAA
jgi:sugar/nucleoside kinase (ribokinase family)